MSDKMTIMEKIKLRQTTNRQLLIELEKYVEKYPELRFNQILYITNIIKKHDTFAEESVDTLNSMQKLVEE